VRAPGRTIDRIGNGFHLGSEPPISIYADLDRVVGGVRVMRHQLLELRGRFVDGELTKTRSSRPFVQLTYSAWGHGGAPSRVGHQMITQQQ